MTATATPNVPSRDLAATTAFYERLEFSVAFRDDAWMVLRRETLVLEFFPHPRLEPKDSWFGCCLRPDDLAGFHRTCEAAGVPEAGTGMPRLHAPALHDGLLAGALVDPDGSLLRLIWNCSRAFSEARLAAAGLSFVA